MSQYHPPVADFLMDTEVVDFHHPQIQSLAASLSGRTPLLTAKNCFDWVRDHIEHSIDFHREEVACKASDVLRIGTGLCTAKSHLLVALWRAHQIPSGFCYQRLIFGGDHASYCTHGFEAVWLDGLGWYRCDARGNTKPGIHCEFTPGQENLAYPVIREGERFFPDIWALPWPELVTALESLPDISQYLRDPIDVCPPAASGWVDAPAAPSNTV